ncbi:DUF4157 domain-containing protein [Actinoplanes sp. CA-051413]|uniref:eCIS core domain-containing protein n=1 Tax=Actinoplanes sp. CA-051413 TaxID=3239899 RepID=UPI003D99D350
MRALLEPRFGADFSRVRVHDDSAAGLAAQHLHAHAFTVGDDVYLGAPAGLGLRSIAHELAHVVQYRNGGIEPGAETTAHGAAAAVLSGHSVDPAALGGRPPGVARDADSTAGPAPGLHLTVGTFDGFPAGGADLTPTHRSTVRFLASLITTWIGTGPAMPFRVVARAGAGGPDADLAARRARAVAGALIEAGVPAAALALDPAGPSTGAAQVVVEAPRSGPAVTPVPDLLSGAGAGSPATARTRPDPLTPTLAGRLTTPTTGPPGDRPPDRMRPGTVGDVIGAVVKVPAVADLLESQRYRLLERTTTGEKVVLGAGVATMAGVAVAGLAQLPEFGRLAREKVDGLAVPLALLADRDFRIPIPGTARSVGFDMRSLGSVPNDILRATTVQFRTLAPSELRAPAGTVDLGFSLSVDLAKLPAAKALR